MTSADEKMMDMVMGDDQVEVMAVDDDNPSFQDPDFVTIQTAINAFREEKLQECVALKDQYVRSNQEDDRNRAMIALRDLGRQLFRLYRTLRHGRRLVATTRCEIFLHQELGLAKVADAEASKEGEEHTNQGSELVRCGETPVFRVSVFKGSLRTQLLQPVALHDRAVAKACIVTRWIPSIDGAPRKTFVLLATARTINILRYMCIHFHESACINLTIFLIEHPEIAKLGYPMHYSNAIDRRAFKDPISAKSTGNLVDVLVYQRGSFTPERTDSMLLVARVLPDGSTEYYEPISDSTFEYGTFGENDLVIWLNEHNHRNVHLWRKELLGAEMEINRANKLNAKEAMEKEAHRKQEAAAGATQEAGRNAEDYDDLDGLADTMVVSTVGGPSKKRRWDDEKDNIA